MSVGPNQLFFPVGEQASLSCTATGWPAPVVGWEFAACATRHQCQVVEDFDDVRVRWPTDSVSAGREGTLLRGGTAGAAEFGLPVLPLEVLSGAAAAGLPLEDLPVLPWFGWLALPRLACRCCCGLNG